MKLLLCMLVRSKTQQLLCSPGLVSTGYHYVWCRSTHTCTRMCMLIYMHKTWGVAAGHEKSFYVCRGSTVRLCPCDDYCITINQPTVTNSCKDPTFTLLAISAPPTLLEPPGQHASSPGCAQAPAVLQHKEQRASAAAPCPHPPAALGVAAAAAFDAAEPWKISVAPPAQLLLHVLRGCHTPCCPQNLQLLLHVLRGCCTPCCPQNLRQLQCCR